LNAIARQGVNDFKRRFIRPKKRQRDAYDKYANHTPQDNTIRSLSPSRPQGAAPGEDCNAANARFERSLCLIAGKQPNGRRDEFQLAAQIKAKVVAIEQSAVGIRQKNVGIEQNCVAIQQIHALRSSHGEQTTIAIADDRRRIDLRIYRCE
jgi:hypothetical protein